MTDGKPTVRRGALATDKFPAEFVRADVHKPDDDKLPEANLTKHREDTRRWLAVAIMAATVILAVLYGIAALWASEEAWTRAEGPTNAIFTAFVGLAGSAIGYYFAKSEK